MYDRHTRSVVGGLDFFEEVEGRMRAIKDKDGIYSTVSQQFSISKDVIFSICSPMRQFESLRSIQKLCHSFCSFHFKRLMHHYKLLRLIKVNVRLIFMTTNG